MSALTVSSRPASALWATTLVDLAALILTLFVLLLALPSPSPEPLPSGVPAADLPPRLSRLPASPSPQLHLLAAALSEHLAQAGSDGAVTMLPGAGAVAVTLAVGSAEQALVRLGALLRDGLGLPVDRVMLSLAVESVAAIEPGLIRVAALADRLRGSGPPGSVQTEIRLRPGGPPELELRLMVGPA